MDPRLLLGSAADFVSGQRILGPVNPAHQCSSRDAAGLRKSSVSTVVGDFDDADSLALAPKGSAV